MEHTTMRGVVMYAPGGVRVQEREDPKIVESTDAIIRLTATCICGSDLWPYRGAEPVDHQVMGHEYVGVVQEIGSEVRTIKVGDFVVGSFWASDNTCEICKAGYQAYCVHRVLMGTIGGGRVRMSDDREGSITPPGPATTVRRSRDWSSPRSASKPAPGVPASTRHVADSTTEAPVRTCWA
jgi:Zn-dependent alcohol dehydrogenase